MSAPNFSYDRRCVLVKSDEYGHNNCPTIGECFDNDRSYPSYLLKDYEDDFSTIAIVLTIGYYSDACIDIVDREDKADELLGYTYHYANYTRKELLDDVCYFLGCSRNFANKFFKGCRYGHEDYAYQLQNAFDNLVDAWRDVEVKKANKVVDKIMKDYNLKELCCVAQFSNGEAWYDYMK